MFSQSGQIGVWTLVTIGASAIIAFSGNLLLQNNLFSSKVDAVKTEVNNFKVDTGKEISQLQTESVQYRKDISDINRKLDDILKLLK